MTAGLTVLLAVASASVNTHVKVETVNFDEDLLNTEQNIAETFAWKEKKKSDVPCVKFVTHEDEKADGLLTIKTDKKEYFDQVEIGFGEEKKVCERNIKKVLVQNTNSDGWYGKVTLEGKTLQCTKNCTPPGCMTENLLVDGDKTTNHNQECMCMEGKECTLEPTEEPTEEKKE